MKRFTTYFTEINQKNGFQNPAKINLRLLSLLFMLFFVGEGMAVTYYSVSGVAPNTTACWKTNRDGTGSSPTLFTAGDTFIIQGTASAPSGIAHSLTTNAIWSISGANSKLWIEEGATLIANHQITLAATTTWQIDANGKYIHNNTTTSTSTTTFGGVESFNTSSTIEFQNFEITAGEFGLCLAACTGAFPNTINWNIQTGTTNYIVHNTASITRTLSGNLTISQTGLNNAGSIAACGNVASPVFEVIGNTILNGGKFYLGSSTISLNSPTLTLGNFTMANGTIFDMSLSATTSPILNLKGNLTNTGNGIFKSSNSYVSINFNGSGNTQIYNNGSSGYDKTRLSTWTIASGAVVQLASNLITAAVPLPLCTFTVNGTLIFGTGSNNGIDDFYVDVSSTYSNSGNNFVLSSGGTIRITSISGIAYSSSLGNIRTSGSSSRYTLNAGANYHYIGNAAQVTGNALPSSITTGKLVINNTETITSSTSGVTLSRATNLTGNLTLTKGILTTTRTNLLTITSAGTISGGASDAYVNGPLSLGYNTSAVTFSNFPIGKGGRYLPATVSANACTNGSTLLIEAFSSNSGGTASGFCSLSTSEYWLVAAPVSAASDSKTIKFSRPETLNTLTLITSTAVQTLANISAPITTSGSYTSVGSLSSGQSLGFGTPIIRYRIIAFGNSTSLNGGTATPTSNTLCYNTSTTISLSGNSSGSIQWQQSADGSTGWANVTGGSGATTATYTTPSLTTTTYYRAIISGSSPCSPTTATSSTATVTVSPTNTNTWSGATSTNWNTASNWVCSSVPTSSTNVVIPSGATNMPNISSANATANSVTINSGASLTMGSYTLTLTDGGSFTNNGTFNAGTGTVTFAGVGTIAGAASLTFNNLTITGGTNKGVVANKDFTVNGNLNLGTNPNDNIGVLEMVINYTGYAQKKYGETNYNVSTESWNNLNSHVLTMGPSATTTGTGDVTGKIFRDTIAENTNYTFGNKNTELLFNANGGTNPTEVTVIVTRGIYGTHIDNTGNVNINGTTANRNTVKRLYQIIKLGGNTASRFKLRMAYQDSELNGNLKDTLVTWDHHLPYDGITPHEHGKTNISDSNSSENWVELSNHSVSYLADANNTNFTKYWMLSTKESTNDYTWLGAVNIPGNTNWNVLSNWVGGKIPDNTSNVYIPDATKTPSDPVINTESGYGILDENNNPSVQTGSGIRMRTLEIASGGVVTVQSTTAPTITLYGGPNSDSSSPINYGSWVNNGTFTPANSNVILNYDSTALESTIAGTTQFYNLEIASGKKLLYKKVHKFQFLVL